MLPTATGISTGIFSPRVRGNQDPADTDEGLSPRLRGNQEECRC
jgi:hypothetical protein